MKKFFFIFMFLLSITMCFFMNKQSMIRAEEVVKPVESSTIETKNTDVDDLREDDKIMDVSSPISSKAAGGEDISILDPSTVRNVANWADFISALSDNTVEALNITSDFQTYDNPRSGVIGSLTTGATTNVSGGASYVYLNNIGISRKVIIEGNGHQIDFRAVTLCFNSRTASGTPPWDITYQNMEVYHGNWYGIVTLRDLTGAQESESKLTLHNVKDTGNQLIHSERGNVFISGKSSNKQASTYTSKFQSNWAINYTNQANMFISNLTLLENTEYVATTINSGNIELGYNRPGNLKLEKNSKLDLIAGGTEQTGYEGWGTNILVWNGSVSIGENAILNLKPQSNSSAISLRDAGASITVGKGGQLNINSVGHTNNSNGSTRNIIWMARGSNFHVLEEGALNINATGMGNSDSNIVHVDGNAYFTVRKKGKFDIKSDSTSQAQNLLYFNSNGSQFKFADAERVNLQRTGVLGTANTNGLINIASTGGKLAVDIQKVNRWSKGNMTETPTSSWTPMYGTILSYSGYTPTVTAASSLLQANVNDFKTNFTTRNAQRVLYEYIPDVDVSIASKATDVVVSANSKTVYGTTNPGAYVRLTDVPIKPTVPTVFEKNKNMVPSPVTSTNTGENPKFYENFTIQADATGNYSYTLPENKHFSAGTVITAYSFLNGKSAEASQTVLDETAPTGEAKEYHAGKGTIVPNPMSFIKNPTDANNPIGQNFTYAYSSENDSTVIATMLNIVGEHIVKVDLFDDAKNKTTITSKLIVHETTNTVTANGLSIGTDVLLGMNENQLKEYILANSNPSANKIMDGIYTDLSNKVQITSISGLTSTSSAGEYRVTLSVKKEDSGLSEDLATVILITVFNTEGTVTVNFVNEADQVLPGYTVIIDGMIGDVIDLTKNESMTLQLMNVVSAGYDIVEHPVNESSVTIDSVNVIVQYKIQGVISLSSVPNTLGFGSLSYEAVTKRIEKPTLDKQLVVTDTRADASNGFKVTATLSTPMTNASGKKLENALRYVYKGNEKILDKNAQEIYVNNSGSTGSYIVSDSWDGTLGADGVKLQISSSDVVYTGGYTGVITWKIIVGQP